MNTNPLVALMHSRKALIATVNIIASTITLLLGHYFDPQSSAFYIGLVAMWLPVVIIWIKSITDEDNSRRDNAPLTTTQSISPNLHTITTVEAKPDATGAIQPKRE